jgi:hypothetical protein
MQERERASCSPRSLPAAQRSGWRRWHSVSAGVYMTGRVTGKLAKTAMLSPSSVGPLLLLLTALLSSSASSHGAHSLWSLPTHSAARVREGPAERLGSRGHQRNDAFGMKNVGSCATYTRRERDGVAQVQPVQPAR